MISIYTYTYSLGIFRSFGLVKLKEHILIIQSCKELLIILENPPIITTQTQR